MFSKKSRQIEAKTHCLLKGLGIGFRYRRLTDTLRIVQRDSIAYEVTITETKVIRRPLTWYDHLSRAVLWLNIGFVLLMVIRYYRKLKKGFFCFCQNQFFPTKRRLFIR